METEGLLPRLELRVLVEVASEVFLAAPSWGMRLHLERRWHRRLLRQGLDEVVPVVVV